MPALFPIAAAIAQPAPAHVFAETRIVVRSRGAGFGGKDEMQVLFQFHAAFAADMRRLADPAPAWTVSQETTQTLSLSQTPDKVVSKRRWIDGRACPQLAAVLDSLGRLPAVRPYTAKELGETSLDPPAMDGVAWSLSYQGSADGVQTSVELSDASGDLVGRWWRQAEQALASCWRDTEPGYP